MLFVRPVARVSPAPYLSIPIFRVARSFDLCLPGSLTRNGPSKDGTGFANFGPTFSFAYFMMHSVALNGRQGRGTSMVGA